MANPTNAFGLKPVRYLNGSPWDGKLRACLIPSSDGNNRFIGDPVVLTGVGNTSQIERIGGSWIPGALSTVAIATSGSGNKIGGVICGFMPTNRDSEVYGAASTDRVALVCVDPFVVYQIRDDGASALGTALVGANAVIESGSGSTVTGLSGWVLDTNGTAPSNNAAYQVTILNAANIQNNDATLASTVWEVQINLPQPFPGIVGFA